VPWLTNGSTVKGIPAWLETIKIIWSDWITGLGACRWISEVLAIELMLALRAKCKRWQVAVDLLGTLSGLIDTVLVVVLAFICSLYGDRVWHGLINLLPSQIGIPLRFLTAKFSELLYQSVIAGTVHL